MEGTRVYVPDERLVWVPATVVGVDASGKRIRVRVDDLRRTLLLEEGQPLPWETDDAADDALAASFVGDERVIDLTLEHMPDALPLQNSPADMAHSTKQTDPRVTQAATSVLGDALMRATSRTGAQDMCELHHLHEPAIVYNIRNRFFAQAPYTYTGKIVVAVNPYRWIKPLYSEALRELYTAHPRDALPPHVYATSAEAFRNMKHHRIPQSILVSGESGAGKTETVKIMMEHLASISMANTNELKKKGKLAKPGPAAAATKDVAYHSVVEKVLKSNPLLEAFGNAKTIRNDNSSRFGKFTQLKFNTDYCLVGAECRHYLLEKSRVVAQADGERNYHIFYQLVSAKESQFGFSDSSSARDFRYLQDEEVLLDGQTDLERYQVTRDALSTIGVSDDEQDQLFRALCGILHLGELEFVPVESDKNDSCLPLASLSVDSAEGAEKAAIQKQKVEIQACADLLGVEVSTLCQKLCSRTVRARQEVYSVPLSALQAGNNRDALAKELYARLFAYLVRRVNNSIGHSQAGKLPSYLHIDLLDIFGFESFGKNSFEQFCINFANEKLQQKFTQDVFKTVQEEYVKEQVGWEFVKYKDNQDMLDLLENSMGLMALLNEECVRPMGSDASFASKIISLHESHPRLEKARLSQMQFMLHHYAGQVTYDAEGFVEKNRDSLQSDLLDLLTTSANTMIAGVFGAASTENDADLAAVFAAATFDDSRRSLTTRGSITSRGSVTGRKTASFMQETVSYKFKAQLALLMNDIASTEVHYVRCIKPNSKKSPHSYEIEGVISQLRCAGVIEAIRITRAAFPNKMSHEKFLRRFVLLKDTEQTEIMSGSTAAAACERLIQSLLGKDFKRPDDEDASTPLYVVGKTLIYFGKDVLEHLEHRRTVFVHDCAVRIQRAALRWFARKRMGKIRYMVTKLQAIQKRKIQRRVYLHTRVQCIRIQSLWRGVVSRRRTKLLRKAAKATRIQSYYRMRIAARKYQRFRNAVIKIQARKKMKTQMVRFQLQLEQKREQTRMENEVALLKQRLEDEKRTRLEIEAENSTLQQELHEVRQSTLSVTESDLPPPYQPNRSRPKSEKDTFIMHDEAKLLDDSEKMIDYLKKEVVKGRELIAALTQENENLKAENKKVKDAYAAAGASFAALNQHNKQQSRANLRLMSTHAALIKSQEEKMKKYQKQIADLKEDLKMQRSVYSAELMARVQQQDLLVEMVRLCESYGVQDDLLEKMQSMIENSKPIYNNGAGNYPPPMEREGSGYGANGRFNRSDTISSTGPVSVSVSQATNGQPVDASRASRRATIDSVLMNPPLPRNLVDMSDDKGQAETDTYADRNTWVSGGRTSVYFEEESRHRKSRIGGMFKKMFKKDHHSDH
ncbi:hypothetical protein P43SY_006780 [Pythium insidiosum]|uniref:Myosin motor domain-containing protein n=1 Tax=Pythium insidiosum TaxID=114742 RepID=A0AAD5M9B3_PYTIN|nr:hypothetical protein P43SY_006780 [Pythium insidiosum]